MCGKLKTVELPEGLLEVPYQAFKCCDSLEEITIPSTVEIIGDFAFELCLNLKHIYVLGRKTRISTNTFLFLEEFTAHCHSHSFLELDCHEIISLKRIDIQYL
jgi:hypothetical protein